MASSAAKQQTKMTEAFTDEFYMYRAKVEMCPRQDIHSYSTCPYLHLNEQSAQRRDPQLYKYDSIFCYDLHNTKACKRGPNCPYSHNMFEYFLHPSRFRTRMCEYGANCKRELCFFAHSESELRPRFAVKAHSGGRRSGRQHRAAAAAAAAHQATAAAGNTTATSDSGSSMAGSPTVCILEVPSMPLPHASSSGSRPFQFEGQSGVPLGSSPQNSAGLMQSQPQPYQALVLQQQQHQQQPSGLSCTELLAPLDCTAASMGFCNAQQLLPGTVPSTQCMMAVSCMDMPQLPQMVSVSCMGPVQDSQQVDMTGAYVMDTAGTNWGSTLLAQQPVLVPQQQHVLQPQQQYVLLQASPQQQVLLQAGPQQQMLLQASPQQILAPMQQQVLQLQPGTIMQAPQMQLVSSVPQMYTCLPAGAPLLPQGSFPNGAM